MKIVFFGTSEYAIPSLEALAKAGYDIAAVVTQPDKPAGRKQEPFPSPIKQAALDLGLKVIQPVSLNSKFEIPDSDLFIVASYGKIIPGAILALSKFGTLNIHPSLLPKYRGPSPIQAAILNGDAETGVTIIKLDEEMDHGNIIANIESRIENLENYKSLHDRLAKLGAELLIQILPKYIGGEIKPIPQDHAQATFTKIITKDDARIDWSQSAEEIDRMVGAYHVWPVAWTTFGGKRLKIFESFLPLPEGRERLRGGKVGEVELRDNTIIVHCGRGLLKILSLQPEGGRVMTTRDFINGYTGLAGQFLV